MYETILNSLEGDRKIKISGWNMQRKFRTGKYYAKYLCNTSDFVALSEHGLYECELNKLEDIHPGYMGFGKEDKHLKNENFGKVNGYNGCALIWKKSINNRITKLPNLGSDRICVVKFKISDHMSCYIIAVYLPHQSCKIAKFEDEVMELEKVIIECLKDGQILVIGDENVQLSREYGHRGALESTRHAEKLMRMFAKYKITCYDTEYATGPSYTYEKAGIRTYLDHVFVSDGLLEYIDKCEVLEETIENVSDHLPISVSLNMNIPYVKPSTDIRRRVAWNKISKSEIEVKYKIPLEHELSKLTQKVNLNISHAENGDVIISRKSNVEYDVITVLRSVACSINTISATLPQIQFNKALKSFWDPNLKTLSKNDKAARREWVAAGKPRDEENVTHQRYKKAKADFQRERRKTEISYEVKNLSEMGDSGEMDSKFFWHAYRKFMKKNAQ